MGALAANTIGAVTAAVCTSGQARSTAGEAGLHALPVRFSYASCRTSERGRQVMTVTFFAVARDNDAFDIESTKHYENRAGQ